MIKHIESHSQGAGRECSSISMSGESAQSNPPSKHIDIMCPSVYHYTEEITRCRLGELCSLLIRSRLSPLIVLPPRSQPGPRSAAMAGSQVRRRSDCTLHVTKRANCHSPIDFRERGEGRGRVSQASGLDVKGVWRRIPTEPISKLSALLAETRKE